MFVASGLYKYATGAGSKVADENAPTSTAQTPADSRVKRHPKRATRDARGPQHPASAHPDLTPHAGVPTSPPPSYASVAAGQTSEERRQASAAKIAIIESILGQEDLYLVLGIKRSAKPDEVRRGFLNRSRSCHPDKFPDYPPATEAFQKVSFAYETLSKPSSRRMYDVSGRTDFAAAMNTSAEGRDGSDAAAGLGDDTLNGVLYSVFCEFMEGDFEMIRVLVNALNDGNPSMNLGDDAVDSIEGAFKRVRDIMLAGKRYLSVIRFELIRLYEIQHSLRQLSYFNISGRLRLTLQLARVTISIPLAIDQAMKQPAEGADGDKAQTAAAAESGDGRATAAAGEEQEDSDSEHDDDDDDGGADAKQTSYFANPAAASADFGVAPEDDNDSDSDSNERSEVRAEERIRARQRASRARRKAAKRERRGQIRGGDGPTSGHDRSGTNTSSSRSQHARALQRKGLLPTSAVGLLRGVVKVLETSEAWVPGGGGGGGGGGADTKI
ncbi:unnamed protein product [Parajaminaea phylloscopi]